MAETWRGFIDLLINASATGVPVLVNGGRRVFSVVGTFGGATVTLQWQDQDTGTWVDVPNAAFTAPGTAAVDVGERSTVRANVTGGAPSGLYAKLSRVPEKVT
jgi:hypothetical protein